MLQRFMKRLVGAACAVATQSLYAGAQNADLTAPPPLPVVIATIRFDATAGAALAKKHDPPAPVPPPFRHTFGAERRTPPAKSQPPVGLGAIDADVVLVTGITDLTGARAMFPARSWRLLPARPVAAPSDVAVSGSRAPRPFTAIALRYRPDLRMVADIASEGPEQGSDPTRDAERGQVVLARMTISGRPLWLASVDFTACPAPCKPTPAFDHWLTGRRTAGEAVVIAGRFPEGIFGAEPLPTTGHRTARSSEDATRHPLAVGSDVAAFPASSRNLGVVCEASRMRLERLQTIRIAIPSSGQISSTPHCLMVLEFQPK